MFPPIEVRVFRGELVESVHLVDAAVVDAQGALIASAGNPGRITYWRSAAKPFQLLPLVEAGGVDRFGLDARDLAVACASHSGEPVHVAQVRHFLAAAGLDEAMLQCGAHPPLHEPSARLLQARGESPAPIHCNCSGKHAAMLALARLLGADTARYLEPEHPVQKRILDAVAAASGMPRERIGVAVDGCGAPVFALELSAMARAYARLAAAEEESPLGRIRRAMIEHPYLVAGAGRLSTEAMELLRPELVAKSGAEGVFCAGLTGPGFGIALKVRDGAARAAGPALLAILNAAGLLGPGARERLAHHLRPEVRNHSGRVTGHVAADVSHGAFEALRARLEEASSKSGAAERNL